MLDTLNKELKSKKENNLNWLDESNQKNKNPSSKEFLQNYMENNDSIIQHLFFLIKQIKSSVIVMNVI